MRRIPKTFQMGSHRWTVRLVTQKQMDRVSQDQSCYGLTTPDELTIYLVKPHRGLRASIVRETFWHEYAHALVWTVYGGSHWTDEKRITPLGHALKQFHDSKE